MRAPLWLGALTALWCVTPSSFAGLESQELGTVESLPTAIAQVFTCGSWVDRRQQGHYRIVLVNVNGGAGTEVYIQRILESPTGSNQALLSTTPVRELNNDHSQYQVSNAKCASKNSVELMATYEHDESNVQRRITLVLTSTDKYRIRNVVIPATNRP